MEIRLCTVGLDAQAEQRTRLAGQLLAAYGFRVRIGDWDEYDCHVLLVNNGDEQGRRIAGKARQRGIAVLTLLNRHEDTAGVAAPFIAAEGTAATLAAALQQLLSKPGKSAGTIAGAQGESGPVRVAAERRVRLRNGTDAAIARLALSRDLRGHDVRAAVRGRTISIHPFRGRVFAASHSDLLVARDMLGEPGWLLEASATTGDFAPVGEVWTSIDAFFVLGALKLKEVLPAFPYAEAGLNDWPDLGAAPEAVVALRVARVLSKRGGGAWRTQARSAGLPATDVNACLWAFAASNLLTVNRKAPTPIAANPPQRRVGSAVLAKLAARFGLNWRSA